MQGWEQALAIIAALVVLFAVLIAPYLATFWVGTLALTGHAPRFRDAFGLLKSGKGIGLAIGFGVSVIYLLWVANQVGGGILHMIRDNGPTATIVVLLLANLVYPITRDGLRIYRAHARGLVQFDLAHTINDADTYDLLVINDTGAPVYAVRALTPPPTSGGTTEVLRKIEALGQIGELLADEGGIPRVGTGVRRYSLTDGQLDTSPSIPIEISWATHPAMPGVSVRRVSRTCILNSREARLRCASSTSKTNGRELEAEDGDQEKAGEVLIEEVTKPVLEGNERA